MKTLKGKGFLSPIHTWMGWTPSGTSNSPSNGSNPYGKFKLATFKIRNDP